VALPLGGGVISLLTGGEQMNSIQWTLKPGERCKDNKIMSRIIDKYLESHPDYEIMVLDDEQKSIYFLHYKDFKEQMLFANVAMLYNGNYIFLPEDTAQRLAEIYLLHIKLVAGAYDYLQQEYGE
jgi:hypothetical protein